MSKIQGQSCSTNVTVVSVDNSGPGTLRQALVDVCSGGTINFATELANQTITLTSAELTIAKTVTIANPHAANLQISGNKKYRVFSIQTGATVTMSNLSIISGTALYAEGGGIEVKSGATLTLSSTTLSGNLAWYGGGIQNGGTLILNNSILRDNLADLDNWGEGGGIINNGTLIVNSSIFSLNSAYSGGGISNSGTLTLTNSILSENLASSNGGAF